MTTRFAARNPAFDVTPAELITAIVTEHGVHRAPYAQSLAGAVVARVKALDPRGRLRDAAASADRHVGQGAAAGRRTPDHRLDRRQRSPSVAEVDEVHVVTNARKAPAFARWAEGRDDHRPRRRHDVERRPPRRDRRHAVRDRARRHRRRPARDRRRQPVRVRPRRVRRVLARRRATRSAIAVQRRRHARARAAATASSSSATTERVVDFVEKPEDPPSTLAATATYLFHRAHVPLVAPYLDDGNPPDQPGRLRRLAARARAGLRLARSTRAGRHRRPRAAARGGQPPPSPRAACPSATAYSPE